MRTAYASTTGRVAILLVGGQALTALAALLTNVLSARVMGPSGRGDLAFWLQIAYLLGTLAMLGIERPYVAASRKTFGGASFDQLLLLPVTLITLLVTGVACAILYVAYGSMVFAAACGIGFMALLTAASRIIRTGYISSGSSFTFALSVVVTQLLLIACAVAAFLQKSMSPNVWLAAYLIASSPNLAIVLVAARRSRAARSTREQLRGIQIAGMKLIPASIGNTAMLRSDRLLLPILSSTRELGLYVVVATTMELASWPVANYVDAAIFGWRQKLVAGTLSTARLMIRAVIVATGFAIVFAVASYYLVKYFLGSEYSRSAQFLLPLAIAAVIYSASRVLQGILIADDRGGAASVCETIGMIVAVVCYLLLIPKFGGFGAAIGSAIGYGAGCGAAAILVATPGRGAR